MTNIIAYLLYIVVSLFGVETSEITLCQGNTIDGISQALQTGDNYLVLSNDLYFIDDSCNSAIQIYKISESGIEPYNG